MQVGAAITPFHADSDAAVRLAGRAEELAYADFSIAEGWTHDAVVVAARIAATTERIGVGTGVLSVWSRTPASIAMAAASLQNASNGRFSLGLGASSPPLVEGLHGVVWSSPVARMRETITATRALLEGGRLPLERDGVRPLRLGTPPVAPVPILVAALAPRSVRLAGELADGWVPFLWARSRLGEGRALLEEGEARAEHQRATAVTASVPVALADDDETARALAAGWLVAYLTRMGPIYPRMLRETFGFAEGADAVLEANSDGGLPRLPPEAEPLAREVTVMGTYDEAPERVREWVEAGADAVSLVLPLGVPEEQMREMLEAAAPSR